MNGSCMKLDEILSIFILAVFPGFRLFLRLDKTTCGRTLIAMSRKATLAVRETAFTSCLIPQLGSEVEFWCSRNTKGKQSTR
jgi:hypothetical protein